jgi:sugar phosphate isomerase/epimerase
MTALGRADLVLSHYSLPRGTPLPERAAAAAAAGFAGIGWHVADYVAMRCGGGTDDEVREILDTHGIVLHEVDALALDRLGNLDPAIRLATTFGAHHLQVQGNRPGTVGEAAHVIADIADRVAPAGVNVAIEFLGCNNIATAADAFELADRSRRPNVGVQVDVWHHVRGANDWALLRALPLERIMSVQIDDGPIEPVDTDYLTDTVHHRRVPGAGEFDLQRFLSIVHPPGSTLPLSLEVIDDDLLAFSPFDAARRIADSTRHALAAFGHPAGTTAPPTSEGSHGTSEINCS